MPTYRFRLVNVFVPPELMTPTALAGNPLCVFENAHGLGDGAMMALTRQFNLSETTFVLPAAGSPGYGEDAPAATRVRIFTPAQDPALAEMRFAGHPTLGTAHVLRSLGGTDRVTLDLPAGLVPVTADGDTWTLTAPFTGRPGFRPEPRPAADVAAAIGLCEDDLAGPPTWVDTGIEQLIVPIRSVARLQQAQPGDAVAGGWPRSATGRRNIYAFALTGEQGMGRTGVMSRFFINAGNGTYEDPGTGSACANLGGWLIGTGQRLPARLVIDQGVTMARPCRLLLDVGSDGRVRVGGRVVEIASGAVNLP